MTLNYLLEVLVYTSVVTGGIDKKYILYFFQRESFSYCVKLILKTKFGNLAQIGKKTLFFSEIW